MSPSPCRSFQPPLTAPLPRKAEWNVSTHSGNVTVTLVGDVDTEFDVTTFSSDIHDAFGHETERTSHNAPGRELEFTEGNGSAHVEIDAFSGDVRIGKK